MKKNGSMGRFAAFFLIAGILSTIICSCKENKDDIVKPITITDIILKNDQFSILRDIMVYAKMSDDMRSENYTLFAPDDAAFGKANISSASVITSMPVDSARNFLKNHIIKKTFPFSDLKVGSQIALGPKKISITKVDSVLFVNKSEIVIKDVNAANGIIHVIDSLLVR